jgi:hypothetical protein
MRIIDELFSKTSRNYLRSVKKHREHDQDPTEDGFRRVESVEKYSSVAIGVFRI